MHNVIIRGCTKLVILENMTGIESCKFRGYFKDKYIRCCSTELCNNEGIV